MQTKQLAEFCLSLTGKTLSDDVIQAGKDCVEDLLGVAIAGARTDQGGIWKKYFSPRFPGGEAAAWEPGFPRMAYAGAAALNAAYGHLLDMDDVHSSSITHLGAVTIPTALALGSALHRSGREVLAAIAAGYEVGARIGEAVNPGAYHFWHTTGVVGSSAAAAVAGKLLHLTEEQYVHAFGSAGTQAAGLWEFLEDGAMSKPLHTANATLCGIRSAELAQLGLTGASRILEGERGLVRALSPNPDLSALTQRLDPDNLRILQNSFKPYACCRHLHGACRAIQHLMQQGITPENVVSITDFSYAVAKNTVDCPAPATPYAGKFSVQFCLAAALCGHELTPQTFSAQILAQPAIRQLMPRIRIEVDPQLEAIYRADHHCWPHRVQVTLDDGRIAEEYVAYPPGDPDNPFSQEDHDRKFRRLLSGILPPEQINLLLYRIRTMDELADVAQLFPR